MSLRSDNTSPQEFTVRSIHACPSGHLPVDKCEAVEGAPSCVCKTPDGVIDLTKIASYDGTPRYVDWLSLHACAESNFSYELDSLE